MHVWLSHGCLQELILLYLRDAFYHFVQLRKKFISENIPIYTVLFQEFIPRALRQDLSNAKNALMVFRVAKVFAQPHLMDLLTEGLFNPMPVYCLELVSQGPCIQFYNLHSTCMNAGNVHVLVKPTEHCVTCR